MTIEAAHPRPVHRNFAAVEADLALRRTPAVAGAASGAGCARAGKRCASWRSILFNGPDPSRQTESAQMSCPYLAKPFETWKRKSMLLW